MADLSQKAVLVKLSISQWTARKYDKKVTLEIADNHGVQSDAGRYNKVLVESSEIKKITKATSAARTYFYENTLPWSDEYRIRPTQEYLEFMAKLGEFKADFSDRVKDFCNMYTELQQKAQVTLKNMYNPADYPAPSQIVRKFDFSVHVMPLAGAQDFRIDLSKEEVERIGKQLEDRNAKAIKEAMKTAWTRLYETVNHMANKLSDKKSIFRNSLVENIEELTKVLPVLNITGDPELARMCDEVNHILCSYDPDTLRKDDRARGDTGKAAKKLTGKIKKVLDEKKEKEEKEEEDIFDSMINM